MLVSLKEIQKYVNIKNIDPSAIAQKLTDAGIEVEELKIVSDATNLVIGEVIYCEKMENSDHLHITKVNVGDEVLDIVCGAPNVRVGLKVIVAKVGATLPGGIKIVKSTIKGYESNGMLCSLKELGIEDKYLKKEQIEGIEELPKSAVVGNTKVLEYLRLDDTVLNLKLLANRADCMSLFNVAREIGALFNRKVKLPEATNHYTYKEDFVTGSTSEHCKAFYGKVFKNVKIKPSPAWLVEVLRNEGIRSINNIVDIGNYVMLLTGNPVHMYDMDKLPKNELIVRDDINEKVVALDEKEYELKPGDLVVTSSGIPVSIGGVMGLERVEVTPESKNILLEVAHFNGPNVRRTSARLGLSSDSSARFTKGIDKNTFDITMSLITKYVTKLAKATEVSDIIKYDELDHSLREIYCTASYINKRLGSNLSVQTIMSTLCKLHFEVSYYLGSDAFRVRVPSFRNDVEGKADLSEEIVRYLGFGIVKDSLPLMETTLGGRYIEDEKVNAIKNYLSNQRMYEILTYTLVSEKDNAILNYLNNDEPYIIKNPLTEDHKIVRRNLLSSLLNTVEYNLNHQNKDFALFEVSNIESLNVNNEHLAIALVNRKTGQDLYKAENYDFYDLKGYLINIFKLLNINTSRMKLAEFTDSKEFHPGRSAKVYVDNKLVGVFGELHPSFKQTRGLKKQNILLCELNLTPLYTLKTGNNRFKEFTRFPAVTRDYAFYLDETSPSYADIVKNIKGASKLIKNVQLFDLYSDNESKSMALTITLENSDKTFTNEEIVEVDNKVREIITNRLKLRLK